MTNEEWVKSLPAEQRDEVMRRVIERVEARLAAAKRAGVKLPASTTGAAVIDGWANEELEQERRQHAQQPR